MYCWAPMGSQHGKMTPLLKMRQTRESASSNPLFAEQHQGPGSLLVTQIQLNSLVRDLEQFYTKTETHFAAMVVPPLLWRSKSRVSWGKYSDPTLARLSLPCLTPILTLVRTYLYVKFANLVLPGDFWHWLWILKMFNLKVKLLNSVSKANASPTSR